MKQKRENDNQINGGYLEASGVHPSSTVNGSETSEETGTGLTQPCSLSDLVPDLIAMRNKHGAESRIGGICSNIVEMIDNLPAPPDQWVDYMMPDWVPEIWGRLRSNIAAQIVVLRELIHEPQ